MRRKRRRRERGGRAAMGEICTRGRKKCRPRRGGMGDAAMQGNKIECISSG